MAHKQNADTLEDFMDVKQIIKDPIKEENLEEKLEMVLKGLKLLMEKRKNRIEQLRSEIERIEADNKNLEETVSSLLSNFYLASFLFLSYYKTTSTNKAERKKNGEKPNLTKLADIS